MGSCSPVYVIRKPCPLQEVFITCIFDSSYLPEEWTFKYQKIFVVYMALELLIIVRIFFLTFQVMEFIH